MGSLGNPRTATWAPLVNTKDCSQGFCSVYCPQWCYKVFPPPPPPPFEFPEDSSRTTAFSPLVIAIIGILASAFLLVTYYALISKFCRKTETRGENHHLNNPGLEEDHNPDPNNPSIHEPWLVETIGLDEALIKSITVCKYKKGVSLIDKTCSVCLSEFQEDESIRLLPKCTHAFHIPCIDTWLKSRSNCPLCRSDIVFTSATPIEIHGNPQGIDPEVENQQGNETIHPGAQNSQSEDHNCCFPKTVVRGFSDLGPLERHQTVIEIEGEEEECLQRIRRTVSMDHPNQNRITVANILSTDQEDSDSITEEAQAVSSSSGYVETGTSKDVLGESSKKRMIIKTSFSSGILPLIRSERSMRVSTVPV